MFVRKFIQFIPQFQTGFHEGDEADCHNMRVKFLNPCLPGLLVK
jgi:hypothetical protein